MGQKRITRYCITLSFRSLVVQTARGLPAFRNWAHRRFVCQPRSGACVLPRELRKERSPAAILTACQDRKGSLGTVSS